MNTVKSFLEMKQNNKKISMLTAYDYSTARILDKAKVNSILVGDSLGMVFQGNANTLSVTIDEMIYHTKAVARGTKEALIIADMPFMSYQSSVYDAVINAGRLIKEGGANAIKLEGGFSVIEHIKKLTDSSIPVCAHIGLTPQSVNSFGGFKVQGKDYEAAKKILEEAKAVEQAGAFAVVLECVPKDLASIISKQLSIPTIGIGAGAGCDGQVLVYHDMLGLFSDFVPKFVKQYSSLGDIALDAIKNYITDVEKGSFPTKEHSFAIDNEIIQKLNNAL